MGVKFLLAAFAAMLVAAPALAQSEPGSLRSDPFSALVGKRQPAAERAEKAAPVERYVIASDDRVFLFQQGEDRGKLKFLCGDKDARIECRIDTASPAEEILTLTPARASRGDVLWTDRRGRTVLRVAAYGGVTVFWPGEARGSAAAKSFGEDPPLTLDFATMATARRRAQAATAIISARVGAPIMFEVGQEDADAGTGAAVLADAVVRAASGMGEVAEDPTGARIIAARIRRVEFRVGEPRVGMQKGALTIDYDPLRDVAGRPSSALVAKFLEDSL